MSKKIVLALGGNALGDDLAGQMQAVRHTARTIVDLIALGHQVVVTHGNGPQVGMRTTKAIHDHDMQPRTRLVAELERRLEQARGTASTHQT